ncbi:hypothetical protein C0033_20110 [Clostridium sp. chh4-2]|uniref:alpha-amylase family protein n=1 Tax=Clostridium sp. chh4-2 TaxID=2067550 RepID=UPI000CCEB5F5|nr:alpha-amylase family protein [Clostridium sp. chh4-2]PNV60149.1 hypothetical protein C0033_20110 [Clostridium sp. chh4-2]
MKHWWEGYPWRMIQTNLREIDMESIDAERYVGELKEFGATVVLLNAAGIIASYPTNLEFQEKSRYLHGDSLKRIIEVCRNQGIRVIARTDFSKIRYGVYEKHPEWAYRTSQGEIVNYNGDVHTCLNGEYQQKFMFEIIKELFTDHDFDGIFCNMGGFIQQDYSGRRYGICHCESCRNKFRNQFGLELPEDEDMKNPVYRKYLSFKRECLTEHNKRFYQFMKQISPELAVNGFDYIRCESNTEIGREQWQYSASSNSRAIGGAGRSCPSDNACVDFMGYRYRHISVSPALMELRQWQNLANGGSVSLYLMGRLDNHMDRSCYEGTKKVFHFHRRNEPYYRGLESAAKVVVMRKELWEKDKEVLGWIRALTESHIPFDEMLPERLTDVSALRGKEILILGNIKYLSDVQAALIDEFAAGGGCVIATGETSFGDTNYEERDVPALRCLGIQALEDVRHDLMSGMFLIGEDERDQFPRCEKTPYIAPGPDLVFARMKVEAKGYMKLIPEHPFGPPERCFYSGITSRPGISVFPYGKGKGIYIPWKIGSFYQCEGYQNTLSAIRDIMFSIGKAEEMAPELTEMVELSIYKSPERTVVQLVNNSGCFANSYFNPLPVTDIQIKLKHVCDFGSVFTLNGGRVCCMDAEDGLMVKLDRLKSYEAIVFEAPGHPKDKNVCAESGKENPCFT